MRTRTWPLSSTSSSDRASVYDLERRELVLIEDLGENRNEGSHEAVVGRPHINGGLLAYIQGSGDPSVELVLKYVERRDATRLVSQSRPRAR